MSRAKKTFHAARADGRTVCGKDAEDVRTTNGLPTCEVCRRWVRVVVRLDAPPANDDGEAAA